MKITDIIKLIKEFFGKNKEIMLPALLFLIVLVVFGRMASNDFIYDDYANILFNRAVQTVINPAPYFSDAKTIRPMAPQTVDVYRPLSTWLLSLEHRLFGLEPFYFHLFSLLLHALNTVLFFLLLVKILGKTTLSFWGALIFGIHPVMTESVAWISQQCVLLSWFFSFLILHLLFTGEKNGNIFLDKKWKKIALLAVFSFLAVFSKEHAVILPLIYVLCVLVLKMNFIKRLGEIAAVAAPVIFYLVLRVNILDSYAQIEPWGGGRFVIFLTMLKGLAYYFRLLVWPWPLSVNYDSFPLEKNPFSANVIFSVAFLLLIIFLAIILWRKQPLFFAGILWIFINFAPVSNFILPMKQIINERFLYFAVPGIILASLSGVIFIKEKVANFETGKFAFAFPVFSTVAVSLIFSGLTFSRLGDWENGLTLWRREIEIRPNDWRNQTNYGVSLEHQNRTEEAIKHYEKALAIAPRDDLESSSALTLAAAYSRIEEQKIAGGIILTALEQFPENENLLFGLARTYFENKQYGKAAEIFESLNKKGSNDLTAFSAVLSLKLDNESEDKIKNAVENIKNPQLRQQIPFLIMGREKMLEEEWSEAASILNYTLKNSTTPIFEAYLWVAESYEKMNEKEKALGLYQAALAVFPSLDIDAAQGVIRNSPSQ